ncbi:hypothetical protein GCM10022287_32480 [Gryllotalpicola koreensis]|uniref:Uncharacterized protein n=2 Tax=Gryllotalpicola koreensis TaxID=993086 RepID=A0ABP8A8J3_9MICO
MESGGGSAAFGSRPPIETVAVDLLERITDEAARVLAQVSKHLRFQTREPVEKPKPHQSAFFYARHDYSALTFVER